MAVVYTNNASTSLSSGIDSSTTSITVGSVADFPTLTGSDYYYATIANTTNTKIEIVKVTAASGTTLTVVRGQDDTTATNFDSGDNFQIRVTSATLDSATKSDVDIGGGEIDGTPIGANSASTGAFTTVSATGNITVGGTVDGRDVATDGTKLDGIEASADVTDTTNVVAALTAGTNISIAADGTISATDTDTGILNVVEDTSPQLGGALDTNGNNIEFGDSTGVGVERLKFGEGSDLHIYHDGSNSYIWDGGTGNLNIKGNGLNLQDSSGYDFIACTDTGTGGTVTIKHSNSTKLTTTSTGISVTGNVAVTGTVDGRDVATDGTKLDGIESGATADQTASEILTAIKTVDGASSGLDADLLDGQHGSYYATQTDLTDGSVTAVSTDADGVFDINSSSGKIQFYINDGGGNSGVRFNMDQTVSEESGSSWEVECNNDAANSYLSFQTDTSVSGGDATALTEEFRMNYNGDFHADGDVIAYSTTISDERLKENIQPIDDALAKVKQLKGCTFTYTADGKESAGLIAQDVEKVLPSAVTEKELPLKQDDGIAYKTLQYDQTIGLLVEAIKELTAKVEELENK